MIKYTAVKINTRSEIFNGFLMFGEEKRADGGVRARCEGAGFVSFCGRKVRR